MRFDIGTLDSGERSLPFGLLVKLNYRPVRRGGAGVLMHPLAGQIISKSCSFSPETEFTP